MVPRSLPGRGGGRIASPGSTPGRRVALLVEVEQRAAPPARDPRRARASSARTSAGRSMREPPQHRANPIQRRIDGGERDVAACPRDAQRRAARPVRKVRPGTPSRQDSPSAVRAARLAAEARWSGTQAWHLRLPRLHPHQWAQSARGDVLMRKTIRKRWQAKLREVRTELRRRMHDPVPKQGKYLHAVIDGHLATTGCQATEPSWVRFAKRWSTPGSGRCCVGARRIRSHGSACAATSIDGSLPSASTTPGRASGSTSRPEARAGCGSSACPDLWRGVMSDHRFLSATR